MEPLDLVNALSATVSAVAAVVSAAVSVRTLGAQRRGAQAQHHRREQDGPPSMAGVRGEKLRGSAAAPCPSPA